jgi:hypothetical protein
MTCKSKTGRASKKTKRTTAEKDNLMVQLEGFGKKRS